MVDDLSEDEIKAYRIADNQLNALTGQDMFLITDELKDLDAAGFDITLTGFDRDIILEDDEDDVLPETPLIPKSKLGDVYQLGPHTIVCGDSTDKDAWQKAVQVRKADCVFTDPPYNVNYAGRGKNTSEGIMNDHMDAEAFDSFLEKAFGCIADIAKMGAGWYVFHSTSTQTQFEKALKKYGLAIRNQLIWNKPTFVLDPKNIIIHGDIADYKEKPEIVRTEVLKRLFPVAPTNKEAIKTQIISLLNQL